MIIYKHFVETPFHTYAVYSLEKLSVEKTLEHVQKTTGPLFVTDVFPETQAVPVTSGFDLVLNSVIGQKKIKLTSSLSVLNVDETELILNPGFEVEIINVYRILAG